MTQVSKYPISKDIEKRIFEILLKVVSDLRNPSEIEEFFNEFLSPVEKMMLAKRLSIAVLLAKNYDYRSIGRILHVSPPTIAKVALSLKYLGQGYRRVIEKLLREEKISEFLDKIAETIEDFTPPPRSNLSYWQSQKEKERLSRRKAF